MNPEKDDFFVGYLDMPESDRRFSKRLGWGLICLVLIISVLIATNQQNPGASSGWDPAASNPESIQGIVVNRPYGMFRYLENGEMKTALLTSLIKTAILDRLVGFHETEVELEGVLIKRDGRRIFAVVDGESGILKKTIPTAVVEKLTLIKETVGRKTLRGEIIDPKCYIGAMKPGGGVTHKACAVLCIKGGIPPMLVQRPHNSNQENYFLLTDENGHAIHEALIPYVGEKIEVSGVVERWGDLEVLKVNTSTVKNIS